MGASLLQVTYWQALSTWIAWGEGECRVSGEETRVDSDQASRTPGLVRLVRRCHLQTPPEGEGGGTQVLNGSPLPGGHTELQGCTPKFRGGRLLVRQKGEGDSQPKNLVGEYLGRCVCFLFCKKEKKIHV